MLSLSSTAGFSVGQTIRLAMADRDGSLSRHIHADQLDAHPTLVGRQLVRFPSKIAAISGNEIPLPNPSPTRGPWPQPNFIGIYVCSGGPILLNGDSPTFAISGGSSCSIESLAGDLDVIAPPGAEIRFARLKVATPSSTGSGILQNDDAVPLAGDPSIHHPKLASGGLIRQPLQTRRGKSRPGVLETNPT